MSTENRGRREQHRERRSLGEKFQQWRQQRREWIAGMTRGQRIRHRLLQAAVVLAIAIIAVWAVMSAWIRVPKVPDPPTAGPDTTQQPGEGEDIQFTGAELPNVVKSGRKEGYYTFLVVGAPVHLHGFFRRDDRLRRGVLRVGGQGRRAGSSDLAGGQDIFQAAGGGRTVFPFRADL